MGNALKWKGGRRWGREEGMELTCGNVEVEGEEWEWKCKWNGMELKGMECSGTQL